ncbi:hypothetical protein [Egbenema bharatensis]|uniref:hypothetical protein n=1 Tax=Egbenema bharatensis TaxID=3463334 RepID=UPI003A8A1F7D
MASPVTLTSTSLEGQVLEVAAAMQVAEASTPIETRQNLISITPNPDGGFVTIVANIPATIAVSGNGFTIAATPYAS